jgi:hypothetical protein
MGEAKKSARFSPYRLAAKRQSTPQLHTQHSTLLTQKKSLPKIGKEKFSIKINTVTKHLTHYIPYCEAAAKAYIISTNKPIVTNVSKIKSNTATPIMPRA